MQDLGNFVHLLNIDSHDFGTSTSVEKSVAPIQRLFGKSNRQRGSLQLPSMENSSNPRLSITESASQHRRFMESVS